MKDAEAQLIHDMQNTAMVLHEAATRINEDRSTLPSSAVDHLCEMLARRSDMLVRLLRDLSTSHLAERAELDLSLQKVSLPDICGELLSERRPATDGRLTVDVSPDAMVIADPMRVTQVLDNLVTNAIRYGGPHIHVSARRVGPEVHLVVSDDGSGVPEDLVDTLFHAYARGEASQGLGGSGLGMLIVRQLCEAMGGTIAYDGSNGARFTASFPALPVSAQALAPDSAAEGHSVTLWNDEDHLLESLLPYVANGLCAGEAVLVTATPAHHVLLDAALAAIGIDPDAAATTGQYVRLDADAVHDDLPRLHQIDRQRFEDLVGGAVAPLAGRWRSFRVFGEIVDLYWRRGDDHLALELEACWNALRAEHPFPLLCGYELSPGESASAICGCHDTVVA